MSRSQLAVDYEDMKTGFQSGKAAALSDWAFRKEQAEFEKVVARLRVRKWDREHPARVAARAKRYNSKPGVSRRQLDNAIKRRLKRHHQKPPITCPGCGVQFCMLRPKKGLQRRFCGVNCEARFQQARRRRLTGAREHLCGRCRQPGHNARTCFA